MNTTPTSVTEWDWLILWDECFVTGGTPRYLEQRKRIEEYWRTKIAEAEKRGMEEGAAMLDVTIEDIECTLMLMDEGSDKRNLLRVYNTAKATSAALQARINNTPSTGEELLDHETN